MHSLGLGRALLGTFALTLAACSSRASSRTNTVFADGGSAGTDGGSAGSAGASAGGASNTGGSSSAGATNGGSSSGGDGGSGGAISISDAYDRVYAAYCHAFFTCEAFAGEYGSLKTLTLSEDRCVTLFKDSQGGPALDDLIELLAAGRVHVDSATLERCVSDVESCTVGIVGRNVDCSRIFQGDLGEGEACQRSEECGTGLHCAFGAGVCPGQCRGPSAAGEPCALAADCEEPAGSSARCVTGTSGAACEVRTIGDPQGQGAECSETGDQLIPCEAGLVCRVDSAIGIFTCQAEVPAGMACNPATTLCAAGSQCAGNPATCTPITLVTDPGVSCDGAIVCDALANLKCIDGFCELAGEGGQGEPCRPSVFGTGKCADGLTCVLSSQNMFVCEPLRDASAACDSDANCASGTCVGAVCAANYCGI